LTVARPQPGIFAQGTRSHYHLEFDLRSGVADDAVVAALRGLREPSVTAGGSNIVVGFGPALWRRLRPADAPAELADFEAIEGDGRRAPATQHDLWVWTHGTGEDVELDVARAVVVALAPTFDLAAEQPCFVYRDSRDLTGFIDGTENPTLVEAPDVVLVPDGQPGAGGTILLLQKWSHDAGAWESLGVEHQEAVIGRRKADSEELDPKAADSHVASTDQDEFGKIFRRNMPYGTVTDHGTMFVGFCNEQRPLETMLGSMAGLRNGTRDALTRFTQPLTGSYYFIPSVSALVRLL
jgi:putative iron-dependent peroxidase